MGYRVILADPPWAFRNVKTGGSMRSGAAAHYATMTTRRVAGLDMESVAGRDAACFLWVPGALLPDGLAVLEAWGFTYRATLVWRKTGRRGTGFWFRNAAEFLILGTRGTVPAFRSAAESVIEAPVGRHSAKPDAAYALIEAATPGASVRVEFFARAVRPGWVQTGNECDGRDVRDAVRQLPAELEAIACARIEPFEGSVADVRVSGASVISGCEVDARTEPPADYVAPMTSEARERIRRAWPGLEGRGESPA